MSRRKEFSRKVRAAIISRAKGCCELCNAALKAGEGEVDHVLPDALGGEPTIANGRLICRVCHAAKTASDIRRIRKADRQRDKGTGAIRPTAKLRGQPWPKSQKSPRIDKSALPALPLSPLMRSALK